MLLGNPEYTAELGRAAYQRCREMFDWQFVAQRWNSLLHGGAKSDALNSIDARAEMLPGFRVTSSCRY